MIRFVLCVMILPMLLGLGFVRLKKEKEKTGLTECYLLGLLFLFLLGEGTACVVIKLDETFTTYCNMLGGAVLGCSLLSLFLNRRLAVQLGKGAVGRWTAMLAKRSSRQRERIQWVFLAVLLCIQLSSYLLYVPDGGGDTTAETVVVTGVTDGVFAYNPVTGQLLRYGMYPLYKVAALPLLYSALQRLCSLRPELLLYYALPCWLILTAFALAVAGSGLLLEEGQREKRNIFLIFLTLLVVMGDGEKSSFAYGLLHGGWKGSVVAAALVLPFGGYMLYRMCLQKEWLYGAAGLLLTLCGLLFTRPLFPPSGFAFTPEDTGRTWGLLMLTVLAMYLVRERTKKKWKKQEVVLLCFCLLTGILSGSPFSLLGIAYGAACMWGTAQEWRKGAMVLSGFLLLICLTGTILPLHGAAVKKYYLTEAEREIQDKIAEVAENYEKGAMLLAPDQVMEQARIYNPTLRLPYGKDLWYENCNREIADVYTEEELLLHQQMQTDYLQPDTIGAMAVQLQCNILVMREEMSQDLAQRYGWKRAENVTGYTLYYR